MDIATNRAGMLVAATLVVTVITQIIYIVALSDIGIVEGWPLRSTLWTIEVLAFTLMAVAALAAAMRDAPRALVWSALAVAALLNVLQAGFGLSMFLPLTEAGEDFAPVMGTIVAGAFLFYFLAKVLIGLAGVGLGLALFRANGIAKIVGVLSIGVGAIAAAVNIFAIPQGMTYTFPAGATGTAAALLTGIAVWMVARREA